LTDTTKTAWGNDAADLFGKLFGELFCLVVESMRVVSVCPGMQVPFSGVLIFWDMYPNVV
jgi:hypothetical protein